MYTCFEINFKHYFQLSLEATAAACDVSSPPVVSSGNRNGNINGHNGMNGFEDITSVPSLAADLRYLRPKKFTIKGNDFFLSFLSFSI